MKHFILKCLLMVLILTWGQLLNAQNVTGSFKGKALSEVVKELEHQTGYSFIYEISDLKSAASVTASFENAPLEKVLPEIIKSPLKYDIKGKIVVITKGEIAQQPAPKSQKSNNVVVTGVVKDAATGETLPGVTVWIKDTQYGTTTDLDGAYRIEFKGNYGFLSVSSMGFQLEEIRLSNAAEQVIDVALKPDATQLEEAVAIGYGTQKKASIVGAIATIDPSTMKVPVSKVSSALAGRLSGVISVQQTGEPGSGSSFWIRGVSTFGANSNPLVLVDGIERSLDLVDIEDVKDFSVLKDAAATAVYGVRGANGVILITTRGGEEGKPRVNIKHESGIVTPTRIGKVIDGPTFARMYNEAAGRTIYDDAAIGMIISGEDPDLYPNVDWVGEVFNNVAYNTRTNVNVSGGTSVVKYFISAGYYRENSFLKTDALNNYNTSLNYNKFNFRANVDVKLGQWFSLNMNIANTFEQKNMPGTGTSNIYSHALMTPAISFPKVYSNGYLPGPGGGNQGDNPYSLLTQTGYRQAFYNNTQAVATLTHDFGWLTEGLTANVKASFDAYNSQWQNRTKTPEQWYNARRDADGNLLLTQQVQGSQTLNYSQTNDGWRAMYLEANVNYARSFGKHAVGGLLLYQMSQKNYVGSSAGNSQAALPYRHQGIAFRATYNYDSRYFIEFNAGYNGSENFSPGHRFGFFPSVAAGWMLSEENFWAPVKNVIDKFKIKGSFGIVGNDQIGGGRRFIYLETIVGGGGYYFGQDATHYSSLRLGDWPNDNVGWEESKKLDVGFDISFFNKLDVQFDYFYENRDGIFLQRESIPQFVGITNNPWVNIGKMRNRGFDLSLKYDQKIGQVQLSALGNFTFARNVILEKDQPDYPELYMNRTGQAYNETFGYISDGLYVDETDIRTSPDQSFLGAQRPGDIKYKDLNLDGVIDEKDQKALGYTGVPEIVYGFGLSARWKGFDASVFFQGTGNVKISRLSTLTAGITNTPCLTNVYQDVVENHWSVDNPDPKADYPRLSIGTNTNNSVMSDFWLTDGSYLRLKSAEIGYTFPSKWMKTIHLSSLRVYVSGNNLATFSSFKLWDPDNMTSSTNYPLTRVVNLGIDIKF
jgi:TonB-linked SusC/RagA family outer membrane protein